MNALSRLRQTVETMDRETRLRWGIGIAVVLLLAVILSVLHDRTSALERKRRQREKDLVEMMRLKAEFQTVKANSERFANRLASVKVDDSPVRLIDEIGIKGKGVQVKPVKGEAPPGFAEDAAEVKIDALTLNETVNLLHKLEKGNKPVVVRKALLRTRFDDPSRLDVTLTVGVLRPVAQERK